MKALFLIGNGVEDLEFAYPFYRLKEAGIEVTVASPDGESVNGKHGYSFPVDSNIEAVLEENFDILVLPGGKGPESVRQDRSAVAIAQKMAIDPDKIVAAICHGIQILISAKVITGRKATCWPGVKDDLIAAGGEFVDSEVVVDNNLITSRKPQDLHAFGREIFNKIYEMSQAPAV